jgi:hypothetical protein
MKQSGLHDKPQGQNSQAMLQYLYMAFLMRLFSRGGDRTLDQLHERITNGVKNNRTLFPSRRFGGI